MTMVPPPRNLIPIVRLCIGASLVGAGMTSLLWWQAPAGVLLLLAGLMVMMMDMVGQTMRVAFELDRTLHSALCLLERHHDTIQKITAERDEARDRIKDCRAEIARLKTLGATVPE